MKPVIHIVPTLFCIAAVFVFFWQFLLQGKLPIPSDTIVGLYHPFRDLYSRSYPRGIPFKNFLITDPIRQEYPWRQLAFSFLKTLRLPLWNPYSFAGTPLLSNFQTGAFYPFNILFLFIPFSLAWSLLILSQPFLSGVFLYLYLRYMKLNPWSSVLGAVTFAFGGFSIAWLEWNTIDHVILWLPLLLLSKEHLLKKISKRWILAFLFAECSALFAGHLQTYFYFFLISNSYLFVRLLQEYKKKENATRFVWWMTKQYLPFLCLGVIVFVMTSIQWIPTVQFIAQSARDVDQMNWQQEGWFIPWQHLIQFVAPDFFGNPTTLNYWGVWNYGEFLGYVGIVPLLFSLFAMFFRRDKKTLFFGSLFFLSLLFSLPTIFAKLPYELKIPFLSTAQPTRLLFVTDFSLAILAALGFDYFLAKRSQKIFLPILFLSFFLVGMWIFVLLLYKGIPTLSATDIETAKRNLYLPSFLFIASVGIVYCMIAFKSCSVKKTLSLFVIGLALFDLFRVGWKFTPFTQSAYLFPQTRSLAYLQEQPGIFRIMALDSRMFPPNFSSVYHLEDIAGYDPLYLRSFAELIAASERNQPNILPPFGFNRIITPHRYNTKIINLFGVKYLLSLTALADPYLKKVYQEGQTRIYENTQALNRFFFVKTLSYAATKQDAINIFFKKGFDPERQAVIEDKQIKTSMIFPTGSISVTRYTGDDITLESQLSGQGFLVMTNTYYPTWHAALDGENIPIYRTDFNFIGMFVPKGNHTIHFFHRMALL